jgi:hypothetical protein
MPTVTIVIADLPEGGLQIVSDYHPATGAPCSPAQQAALEIVNRTRKDWGVRTAPKPIPVSGLDIDAIHRRRDNVLQA